MEQTSNDTELNMTDKITEELVNTIDNTDEEVVNNVDNTTNSEINHEVVSDIENVQLKHGEVVNEIDITTSTENNVQEEKLTERKTKTQAMAKPKTQHDTDSELSKAEMKELADINNQFYTPLNRIDKTAKP